MWSQNMRAYKYGRHHRIVIPGVNGTIIFVFYVQTYSTYYCAYASRKLDMTVHPPVVEILEIRKNEC